MTGCQWRRVSSPTGAVGLGAAPAVAGPGPFRPARPRVSVASLCHDVGDTITLTDPRGRVARVTIADVAQSNGVVHVIDKVLLPAS